MINNDVLRSIRYMLDLSDGMVVDIAKLADPAQRHALPRAPDSL